MKVLLHCKCLLFADVFKLYQYVSSITDSLELQKDIDIGLGRIESTYPKYWQIYCGHPPF